MKIDNFRVMTRIIGKKAIVLTLMSFVLSICLGGVELANVGLLQMLMKNLGLSVGEIVLGPFRLPDLSFSTVLVAILLVGFLRFCFQFVSNQSLAYVSEFINVRLKNIALFDMMYKISPEYVGAGEIFYRFTEVIPKMVNTIAATFNVFSVLIQLIIIFAMMAVTLPLVSVVSIVGIGLIGTAGLLITKSIRPLSAAVNSESRALSIRVHRATRNLLFFGVMRTQEQEFRYLSQTTLNLGQNVLRLNVFSTLMSSLIPFLGIVLIAFVILISHSFTQVSGIALISFVYLMLRFVQNLSVFSQHISQFLACASQYSHGISYMQHFNVAQMDDALRWGNQLQFFGEEKNVDYDILGHRPKVKDAPDKPPFIKIHDLSFRYDEKRDYVLDNVSLNLNHGDILAVTGISGSGKSTLLMLILGIYKPTVGNISIDGLSPDKFFSDRSRRIGYVGAEPYLIKGSIRDNLLYGVSIDVADRDIDEALRSAHLGSFIDEVGLDYEIQEDYSGISAGQRQRLCLARALLNKPTLLILDEATANLDRHSEEMIRESINRLKGTCTVIVVSHNESFIRDIDQRIAM